MQSLSRSLDGLIMAGLSAVLLAGCQTVSAPKPVTPPAAAAPAAKKVHTPTEDSGGVLMPEQAAYDVGACELDLQIFPEKKSIAGTATIGVRVVAPMDWLVLDLDPRFKVTQVRVSTNAGAAVPATFEWRGARLWINLGGVQPVGTKLAAAIDYSGVPHEAVRAPWDGGFTWSKTKAGLPWIATTCESEGADLWWPCKDHPSDKPESFTLRIRVPEPLVVATNGKLVEVVPHGDGTRTYHWHTAFPISNYNIALNIAPYDTITRDYRSVTGETVPVTYWVLPENHTAGEKLVPEMLAHLNFYERVIGPYPFRAEKYGVAETPHLGMEHQSIIAYGNKYRGGPLGYDWLHHHELGHEWWGNLVTCSDWRDFWIHEGICTYMQALYAEEREGMMAYHTALYNSRRTLKNKLPIVTEPNTTSQGIEDKLGNEVYDKGSWVVHMLRYLVGKETMLTTLRRFAYPTEAAERSTDGSACHFATSADFIRVANKISGRDLTWFFNFYLFQAKLPKLNAVIEGDKLVLSWETPEGYPFPMPLEVEVDGKIERIEMPNGRAELSAARYGHARLDPSMWILKENRPVEVQPAGLLF